MDSWLGLAAIRANWQRPSLLATLIGNLVPAFCVVVFGWDAGALLVLYWLENVVVGVVNLFKMIVGALVRGEWGGLFLIPFYSFHYGLFCLGHGAFVFLLFATRMLQTDSLELDHPRELIASLLDRYPGLVWNAVAISLSHLIGFGEWLFRAGWRGGDLGTQMAEPYNRVIVLHLTIMAGVFALTLTHSPVWAIVLLGLFKTGYEVRSKAERLERDSARRVALDGAGAKAA